MEHNVPSPSPQALREKSLDSHPEFRQLLTTRRRFIWRLTIAMLAVYFGYILTLAYRPDLLAGRLVATEPMTLGIPLGFGMFVITFSFVAAYVHRANTVYDGMVQRIRQGV